MGHLQQHAGTVAGIGFATAGAAMVEVDQDLQALLNQVMGLAPLDVRHEPDAAGLVFKLRIIEPLLGREPAGHVTAVLHNNLRVWVLRPAHLRHNAVCGRSKPALSAGFFAGYQAIIGS